MIWMLPLLKGLVVILVATAWWAVYRNRSANVRYRVWTAAFAGLLFVMVAPLILPTWQVSLPAAESALSLRGAIDPVTSLVAGTELSVERPSVAGATSSTESTASQSRPQAGLSIDLSVIGIWLAYVWGVGAALLMVRFGVDLLRFSWIRHRAKLAPEDLQRLCSTLSNRMDLRRPPDLRLTQDIEIPLVLGALPWRQPLILLPAAASSWPSTRLESVLSHELVHVKKKDAMTAWLIAISCALHWPNPVVWWAATRALADREEACDMYVVRTGTDPLSYAHDLLEIARGVPTAPTQWLRYAGTVPMAGVSSLRRRIDLLMSDGFVETNNDTVPGTRHWLLVLLLSVLIGPMALAGFQYRCSANVDCAPSGAPMAEPAQIGRMHRIWEAGAREDRRAVAKLVAALNDADPSIRGMAAWSLGEIKDSSAMPHLAAALGDDDLLAREMIIKAIGELNHPSAIPILREVAQSDEADLRAAATLGLVDFGRNPEARSTIEVALTDPDAVVREAAVVALGQVARDAQAAAKLMGMLYDEAPAVRALAAKALGRIRASQAVDALILATRDSDSTVRASSVWALDEIRYRRR